MLDSVDLMFQFLIDMWSGYVARTDYNGAIHTLMDLRQERQDYQNDHKVSNKETFMWLVNQIDDTIQNVQEKSKNEKSGD